MDSTKLIIGILIIVYFVVKAIIGDTKKEHKKSDAQPKKNPKTKFPPFFYDEEPKKEVSTDNISSTFKQEGQSVTKTQTSKVILENDEPQVDVERWRQAVIDSEILKTKF